MMAQVPTPLTRRSVLRGGLALTALGAVVTTAGCNRGPSAEQILAEKLVPLADAAYTDSANARALAPRITSYSAALGIVADQRAEHARLLREEITRLDEDIAGRIKRTDQAAGSTGGASSSTTPTAPSGDTDAITIEGFREMLTSSARDAGAVCVAISGYAAGLTGAVSASVTSMVEVSLA